MNIPETEFFLLIIDGCLRELMVFEKVPEETKATCDARVECERYGKYYRKIQEHPCYDPKAAHRFGRMHLPVAAQCNIRCNYCVREFDCVNESRPGVTSKVLKPNEAVGKVREVLHTHPQITVIGIAGPGDPLFNEETFTTLDFLQKEFYEFVFCLSTNGLLLPEMIETLKHLKVSNLTVTMNTVDPEIGAKIYSCVRYRGEILKGRRAAEVLIENQVTGITSAIRAGMVVKINTVMIPGINDTDIVNVANKAKALGAYVQNIMPLIPQYKFAHISPPSKEDLVALRRECGIHIRQMHHCRQCRADAVGKLGENFTCNSYKSMKDNHPEETIV